VTRDGLNVGSCIRSLDYELHACAGASDQQACRDALEPYVYCSVGDRCARGLFDQPAVEQSCEVFGLPGKCRPTCYGPTGVELCPASFSSPTLFSASTGVVADPTATCATASDRASCVKSIERCSDIYCVGAAFGLKIDSATCYADVVDCTREQQVCVDNNQIGACHKQSDGESFECRDNSDACPPGDECDLSAALLPDAKPSGCIVVCAT
jgi:hypothetical protein